MKKHPVIITAVRQTKGNTHQLTLSQKVEKQGNGSLIGILMEGHPAFGASKPRITWVTVSDQQMKKYKFQKGMNFSEIMGFEVSLQVNEGFVPTRLTKNEKGELVAQNPKMNPTTGQVLTQNGKPIYRDCIAVQGEAKDTLIQHDVVAVPVANAAKAASVLAD